MIYLDSAATSAVRREVLEAAWPYLTTEFGNPSSVHEVGRSAARGLADARASAAVVLGGRASDIVFTSGGTESDNLAVKGLALANPRGRHIVTTRLEHEAVLASVDYLRRFHGFAVDFVDVDSTGRVDPDAFSEALRADTTLATVQYASNEIGTVQPIAELAARTHSAGALFHSDAVQAAGWLDTDARMLGVDALSISGHKLGAPKGIGLLYVRGSLALEPILHGGGQERGRRSGTENVAGAVAMATALRLASEGRESRARAAADARDALIEGVLARVERARLTGHRTERLPAHASFVFPGLSGEAILLELERRGIVSSSGSACAAGRDEPSHVLLALGMPENVARSALRLSWGPDQGTAELAPVAGLVADAVAVMLGTAPARASLG